MAFDAFIHIDGIEGKSADALHAGWIEVLDYDLGFSSAGGASAGNSAAGWDLQTGRAGIARHRVHSKPSEP